MKIKIKIKPEWAGKEIIVMPYLHSSTEKVSVKTEIQDTKHYKVIKETGFVEKDFSITPQMDRYKIHGVNSSELTVKRLRREEKFDDLCVEDGITKIVTDYNTKYKNNFPDYYYDEFGRYIALLSMYQYHSIEIGFEYVCRLVNIDEDFNNGLGAPLFHIYENIVRKNDDTGLDKVLHFFI